VSEAYLYIPAGMCAHLFISFSHGGHGMARIFCCAPGLVKLVNGGKWEDTGLPEAYQITERRLRGHSKDLGENAPW
jgi:hypothetical protein